MNPAALLGIAALIVFVRFLRAHDRRIARDDYAPYFTWVRKRQ